MSTTPAALKMSRRMSRLFPWFSALVLVAGIVAFTIVHFGTNTAKPLTPSGAPPRPWMTWLGWRNSWPLR